MRLPPRHRAPLLALIFLALLLSACGRNMYQQPKFENYEANPFFANGTTAQLPPEGTVTRDRGAVPEWYITGQSDEGLVAEMPYPLTEEVLLRGMQRYNIYCSPCHNFDGDGDGLVVQRGFPRPTSFHEPRLREAPVGYFVSAIANGFGRMFPYADRVPPDDRWAIAAYIRALQLSQFATVDDVPEGVEIVPAAEGALQ